MVVFPEDSSKWTYPSRYVRTARSDDQGLFRIRGLPPDGGYRAIAVDYLEDGESADPELLQRMKDRATSFSLREGETRDLELSGIER